MKRICFQFASIALIATMFSTMCLAHGDASAKIQYTSAAECIKNGVTDINVIRNIYENQAIRATGYTETGNNTSFSTADTIPIEPAAGSETNMLGTLSSENMTDYYKITPPRHGRVYVAIISPTGYTYTVDLYNSSYGSLGYDIVDGHKSFMATKGSLTSGILPSYYIKVTSSTGYSTNRYRIIVFYALNYERLEFAYPTSNTLKSISSPVGYRTSPQVEYHHGVDIPDDDISEHNIYSICDAVVVRAFQQSSMGVFVQAVTDFADDSEYDDILDEYTNTPYTIRYMHMKEESLTVNIAYSAGTQEISKGQLLGIMGTTGDSTGVHLHIDINNGNHLLSADINNDLQSLINPLDLYWINYTGNPY